MFPLTPADRRAIAIACVVAGLLVAQQAAVRVVRDVLFLSSFPARLLPWAMIASSLAALASVAFASRALSRLPPARFLPWVSVTAGLCFLLEWALTALAPRAAAAALYVHFSAFGGVALSGFWSCVNERFDALTGKEAMRRIGLASSCGALLGATAVSAAVRVVTVSAMLPVLATTAVLVAVGLHLFAARGTAAPRDAGRADSQTESALAVLQRVPYLRVLALVVASGAMSDAFVDYVFKSQAAAKIPDPAALAAFLGVLNTASALVSLAVQTGLTALCLRKLGLAETAALRPAGVLIASAAGFLHPGLRTVAAARACHDVATPSLFRPAYEPLFTPLPEEEKRPTKAVVDVAVDKLGSLLGSALVLILLAVAPGRASTVLRAATVAVCALAVALTRELRRGYVITLERNLRAGVVHVDSDQVLDEATRSTLIRASFGLDGVGGAPTQSADPVLPSIAHLRSAEPERVVRVLSARQLPGHLVGHVIPLLERDDLVRAAVHALRSARPAPVGQLIDAMLDPDTPLPVRTRIPRVLRGMPSRRTVEGLLLGLVDARVQVRTQCGRALSVLTRRTPALTPAPEVVVEVINNEVLGAPGSVDLDHVFTLLSLIHDREPLRLALRALRGGDPGERGTALEYLLNVLTPRLRDPLWPYLIAAHVPGPSDLPPLTSSPAVPINRAALRAHLEDGDSSSAVLRGGSLP